METLRGTRIFESYGLSFIELNQKNAWNWKIERKNEPMPARAGAFHFE